MRTETVYRLRAGVRTPLETLAPAQPRPDALDDAIVSAFRLYLDEHADVVVSDQVEVRGRVHDVVDYPALRTGHALVVEVSQAAAGADDFDSLVTIGPAGASPTFNPATGRTETVAAAPVYVGSGTIVVRSTSDGRRVDAAEDDVDDRAYVVRLPAGAGDLVEVDHVITVNDAPNADLVGERLVVTSIARPSTEPYRELAARLFD